MSDPTTIKTKTASDYSIPAEDHFGAESTTHESLRDKSKHIASEAKRRADATLESAKEAATATYQKAKEDATRLYGQGKETVRESFSQHPLAYAVGAFAAGVVIGMLLPSTKTEGSLLGQVASKAKAKGQELSARSEESPYAAHS